YRVSEKTNQDWVRRWIKAPRGFRPATRMPHFYGLSNNNAAALKGTGQEKFPDAEIDGIAFYLLTESKDYLGGKDKFTRAEEERIERLKQEVAEIKGRIKQTQEGKRRPTELVLRQTELEKKEAELALAQRALELRGKPQTLAAKFEADVAPALEGYKPNQ